MTTSFAVTIRCLNAACGHKYKRVMEAEDEQALTYMPDPPCPKCAKSVKPKRKAFDYTTGKAPGIGGSVMVRSVDATLNLVAEDHKMTDLRTDVREGETMAPKLPPRQQAMADSFFAKPKSSRNPGAGIFGLPPRAVMQAAVSGRFQTKDTVNPVAIQHKRREAAPVHIIAGDGVGKRG